MNVIQAFEDLSYMKHLTTYCVLWPLTQLTTAVSGESIILGEMEILTEAGQMLVIAIFSRPWRTKSIASPFTNTLIPTLPI